jgi:hypothetical protein
MTKQTSTPMSPAAASRIQSAAARTGGGQVAAGTFPARAQSAAAANAAKGQGPTAHKK